MSYSLPSYRSVNPQNEVAKTKSAKLASILLDWRDVEDEDVLLQLKRMDNNKMMKKIGFGFDGSNDADESAETAEASIRAVSVSDAEVVAGAATTTTNEPDAITKALTSTDLVGPHDDFLYTGNEDHANSSPIVAQQQQEDSTGTPEQHLPARRVCLIPTNTSNAAGKVIDEQRTFDRRRLEIARWTETTAAATTSPSSPPAAETSLPQQHIYTSTGRDSALSPLPPKLLETFRPELWAHPSFPDSEAAFQVPSAAAAYEFTASTFFPSSVSATAKCQLQRRHLNERNYPAVRDRVFRRALGHYQHGARSSEEVYGRIIEVQERALKWKEEKGAHFPALKVLLLKYESHRPYFFNGGRGAGYGMARDHIWYLRRWLERVFEARVEREMERIEKERKRRLEEKED